ncbi:MAG: hypothetical protein HY688_00840 [Chloroflexi bacterium]|nr:hypothetical protein [Chloroflexota bacterium]
MDAAQSTPRAPRLVVMEPWKIWVLLGIVLLLGVGSATAWALTSRVRPAAPAAPNVVTAPAALALAPEAVKDLAIALTRAVEVPGGFLIEITYGDPLLLRALGERTPVLASGGAALAFWVNESVHEGGLPAERLATVLQVDGGTPERQRTPWCSPRTPTIG